jgi:endonuclease YncB( thermonuclease family)
MQRFALSLVSTAALALTSTTLLAQGVPAAPAAPAAPAPAPQQEAKPAGVIDAAAKKTYDAAVAAVRKLKGESFVSEMKLDAKSPELAAMVDGDSLPLQVTEANARIDVVARYRKQDTLVSGWAIGEDHLRDKAAVLCAHVGKGRIVLCGIDATYRGQPLGTAKLVFGAILTAAAGEGR